MFSKGMMFAVVGCMLLAFAGFAVASPPVPPPMEGFVIGTSVDINCIGDVIEDEEFTWTWVRDMRPADFVPEPGEIDSSVDPLELGILGRAAQIRYDEQLRAIDSGAMQLNKQFTATSHDEPNVEVAKDYAWAGMEGSGITNVENRERVGLSIVANGDTAGLNDMPSLCPWVHATLIPATNEFIAMGSRTTATGASGNMVSMTTTDATGTGPPALGHTIHAEGLGTAEAEMRLSLMEASLAYDPLYDEHFRVVDGQWEFAGEGPPPLISLTEYEEYTGAFGQIPNFDKDMQYMSVIPAYQMPEPWYSILP
jgi:hypothetical protein